jgi:peptidyl-prolyl cis-trans isomerase SurA
MASLLAMSALLVSLGCSNKEVGNDVMAMVNGRKITRTDVQKFYDAQVAGSPQQPSAEQSDTLRLKILSDLIDNEILMQRAEKLGLLATDEEVNAKLTEIKAPFTQEQFDQRLKERQITLDDFKKDLRRSLTIDKVLNKEVTSKINVTDDDITNYYNQHKAEFNLIEPQYHLAQIVVTSIPMPAQQVGNLQNSKAMSDADAKRKIDMLHNRLESGEDFGALAMNFSEQPNTSGNGGDMGFVAESQLRADPQAYAAISKLNPGQITDVLPEYGGSNAKQPIGYAIYKLIDREAAGQRQKNDPRVQQAIRQQLRDSREQLLKNAYLEMLRDQARVENYYAEEVFKNGAQ